jgi:5-methylcytosine-specific restriction endonuclease McrA
MHGLLSSPARLVDTVALGKLKRYLLWHGVLGSRCGAQPPSISEIEKLQMVPLVFGLMPGDAFERLATGQPIKPSIQRQLKHLATDAELVEIVHRLCVQYYASRKNSGGRRSTPKYGVGDVRAIPSAWRQLTTAQNHRCALCGILLKSVNVTLDHIVPFRLIGDVPDGSNWALLCQDCNSAKGNFVSALQSVHSQNWIYSAPQIPTTTPHVESRYVALVLNRECEAPGCHATATTSELRVVPRGLGLPIVDNLTVLCDVHAPP